MADQIQGKRINDVLGKNELRDYLSNKIETSAGEITVVTRADLRPYKKPLDHNPRVLLIAPPFIVVYGVPTTTLPALSTGSSSPMFWVLP